MSESTKKLIDCPDMPGFKIDPDTGKYVAVAVDFRAVFNLGGSSGVKRPKPNWSGSNKVRDNHTSQPAKYRKADVGVRKELFKMPSRMEKESYKGDTKLRVSSTGARRSLAKILPSTDKKSSGLTKKIPEKRRNTPLKRISELSEPRLSDLPITPELNQSVDLRTEEKTPTSRESNMDEFLRLEQLYKTPKIVVESPVSSVCNLFESKMMLDSENKAKGPVSYKNAKAKNDIISEIRKIAKLDQELCTDTAHKIRQIMEQQVKHEENMSALMRLINQLDDCKRSDSETNEEKENLATKRRSLRLQNKSPQNKEGETREIIARSPGIVKPGDLRRSTLTKSLVDKYHTYQIDSPRIKKALDMYNSTRTACSALLTPRNLRGQLSQSSENLMSNLSLKVQQQCLMLQDTPGPKK